MKKLSRLQAILPPARAGSPRTRQVVRVIVSEPAGAEAPRVTLAPGDRLLVENATPRTIRVKPLDFFGNPFCRFALEPGECTPPMVVTGLWFQVEVRSDGGRVYPLDVYLAPNATV